MTDTITLMREAFTVAIELAVADWRIGSSPSVSDGDMLRQLLEDFNRECLAQPAVWSDGGEALRDAYDLVTDPARRETVERLAIDLYA
jgi:hypothetical protein